MRYDGKLLAKARAELENIKQRNLSEQQRRRDEVYRRCPEIQRIDGEMRAQMAELVRLTTLRSRARPPRCGTRTSRFRCAAQSF